MDQSDYLSQRLLKGRRMPKMGGGMRTLRLNPADLLQPPSLGDANSTLKDGLQGLASEPIQSPFSPLSLFKRIR